MRKEFLYLKDAIHSIGRVVQKTENVDLEQLQTDEDLQDIVEHNLRIVGECVKQLPDEWRDMQPHIPWSRIAGIRNQLVHRYYETNYDTVMEICERDIVPLQKALKDIAREVSGPLLAQENLPE